MKLRSAVVLEAPADRSKRWALAQTKVLLGQPAERIVSVHKRTRCNGCVKYCEVRTERGACIYLIKRRRLILMTKRFRLAEKNKTEPGVVGAWTLWRDVGTSARNRRVAESTR